MYQIRNLLIGAALRRSIHLATQAQMVNGRYTWYYWFVWWYTMSCNPHPLISSNTPTTYIDWTHPNIKTTHISPSFYHKYITQTIPPSQLIQNWHKPPSPNWAELRHVLVPYHPILTTHTLLTSVVAWLSSRGWKMICKGRTFSKGSKVEVRRLLPIKILCELKMRKP